MTLHELKTVEPYFSLVFRGDKPFEIRPNDRDFRVGDILYLREYSVNINIDLNYKGYYHGRYVLAEVRSVMKDPEYVKEGKVAMGLKILHTGYEQGKGDPR